MENQHLQEEQARKQKWVVCDPLTLVGTVRQGIYSADVELDPDLLSGIDEVFTRFEQQSRATIGGSAQQIFSATPSGSKN